MDFLSFTKLSDEAKMDYLLSEYHTSFTLGDLQSHLSHLYRFLEVVEDKDGKQLLTEVWYLLRELEEKYDFSVFKGRPRSLIERIDQLKAINSK